MMLGDEDPAVGESNHIGGFWIVSRHFEHLETVEDFPVTSIPVPKKSLVIECTQT